MQKAYIDAFSVERLIPYNLNNQAPEKVLEGYLWNIALAEALFPSLALFEVTLRNRMDAAIYSNCPTWLDRSWNGWAAYKHKSGQNQKESRNIELEQLMKALEKCKQHSSRGKLIAELNLGFWIGLFKGHYNPHIWFKKGMLSTVFPQLPKSIATQRTPSSILFPKMRQILKLRNRIFHHEPIFNWPDGLKESHQTLCELLAWMSPEVSELTQRIDRFGIIWEKQILPFDKR